MFYESNKYIFNLGRGEIGNATSLTAEVGFLILIMDKLGYARVSTSMLMLILGAGLVGVYILGWFIHRLGVDKIRNDVQNQRNRLFAKLAEDYLKKKA